MEYAISPNVTKPIHLQPFLELAAKRERVDIYVVWGGAPKYLADCIEHVARSFDFHIDGITAEKRAIVRRDNDGTRQARALRRVRFHYAGTRDQFYVGLLAVLEEVERVCPWVHVARLERHADDAESNFA